MKPCPNCGRVGTTHQPMAKTCYACDPPNLDDYTLVEVDVFGTPYLVQRREHDRLLAFVTNQGEGTARIDLPTQKVYVTFDTGMCGKDALARESVPLRPYLFITYRAFPKNHAQAVEDHRRMVEQIKEQMARDGTVPSP